MKRSLITIALLIGSWSAGLASINASISFATFNSPSGPYVELYFFFDGNSLTFEQIDSQHVQAQLDVLIVFEQDSQIVKFDKYRLHSPVAGERVDLIDLKRYTLDNGQYKLRVEVEDPLNADDPAIFKSQVTVDYPAGRAGLSDLQLLASYQKSEEPGPLVKNGFLMEPLPFHFYYRNASHLIFYAEVYGATEFIGEDFAIRYSICEVRGDEAGKPLLVGHQKMHAQPVNVLLLKKDINRLPSGNYRLIVEVRNRNNELILHKSADFQRSNPYLAIELEGISNEELATEFVHKLTPKELDYALRAITPLVNQSNVEILNMVISNDENLAAKRRFLFTYWAAINPTFPEKEYREFMALADALDEKFRSGFGYGFETDRGRIFLQYGAPDDIVAVENDPTAPPYEIWSYYDFPATHQANVKFLFYNPSLGHNDFQLLHSNARGEINNPRWQLDLYRRSDQVDGDPIESTRMQDNWFRHADRFFNDF